MIRSLIESTRDEVVAENGVVAGGHDLVARTGVEVMQAGGNAVDAGVAAAFMAQLAESGMCGVGGNGLILVHWADSGGITIFDDGPRAPSAATPDMFEVLPGSGGFYGWDNVKDDANIVGHLSVGMPGTVAGLCEAHSRYGSIPLADLLAPSVELAQRGIEVDSRTAMYATKEISNFGRFPLLGPMLLVDGHPPSPGSFWAPGDRLVWAELADTYRAIADGGADAFYKGPIAQAIAAEMAHHGGIITYVDMAEYESSVSVLDGGDLRRYRGHTSTHGQVAVVRADNDIGDDLRYVVGNQMNLE